MEGSRGEEGDSAGRWGMRWRRGFRGRWIVFILVWRLFEGGLFQQTDRPTDLIISGRERGSKRDGRTDTRFYDKPLRDHVMFMSFLDSLFTQGRRAKTTMRKEGRDVYRDGMRRDVTTGSGNGITKGVVWCGVLIPSCCFHLPFMTLLLSFCLFILHISLHVFHHHFSLPFFSS